MTKISAEGRDRAAVVNLLAEHRTAPPMVLVAVDIEAHMPDRRDLDNLLRACWTP